MDTKTLKDQEVSGSEGEQTRPRIRLHHVAGWLLVALGLFVASAALGGGNSAAEAQSNDGVLFGAYANTRGGQTQIEAYEQLESQLGAKLSIARTFHTWEDNLDNRLNNWIVDGGRQLMVSIKPTRDNGTDIPWRDIANAQPGSRIHNDMIELARDVRALGPDVWVSFHHEPEARDRTHFGDDDDFIAAWRAFHTVFEQQGANAEWVWTMTSFSFEVDTADRRSAGKWYPGDAYVDYLGADPYNWNFCRNDRERFRHLEEIIAPFLEFGDRHPDKQLVLPEWGSAEGSPGKAGWLDQAGEFLQRPEIADRFAAVIYFNSQHEESARCDWWLDSSSSSLDAARRIAQNPAFQFNNGGNGGQQAPAPAGFACTVRTVNGDDLIEWTDLGDHWHYNVRRDGSWVARTADGVESYRNDNVNNGSYSVIARGAGERDNATCSRI